jgi:hypothetical protein
VRDAAAAARVQRGVPVVVMAVGAVERRRSNLARRWSWFRRWFFEAGPTVAPKTQWRMNASDQRFALGRRRGL